MPLYDCGSVEIIAPAGVASVTIDSVGQYEDNITVDFTVEAFFEEEGQVEVVAEISDRDTVAGRGSAIYNYNRGRGSSTVSDTAYVPVEERPTASTGAFSDTLPIEVNIEATVGGVSQTATTNAEFKPEALERLQITNAEQDGSKVVVDFEVGGGDGFNIGEDDASNIGEVMVKNPVPWADGTEGWIPGLDQSGAAQLLPDPTSIQLGAYDADLTVDGNATAATVEIPLGLTPPEQFGSVASFVGIGVTTENGNTLADTYDITIDPVAWIEDVDASCVLADGQVSPQEKTELEVTLTNNAGPAFLGSTVELDLIVSVKIDGEYADNAASVGVVRGDGEEADSVRFSDVRGPRGVGSDNDGDTVDYTFDIIPLEPVEYNISVEYNYVEGSASRIIPTDEIL